MLKSIEESKKKNKKNSINSKNILVLSIDQNEKIINFNKESEKIFGYSKNEVLNRQLPDFLIPHRYFKQWKNMLKSVKKDKLIDNFKLPLLTKHGHEIMVSWVTFPVKNAEGGVGDIGLVGKLVTSWNDAEEPIVEYSKRDMTKKESYIDVDKTIKKLVKRNFELENNNKKLKKELKNLKTHKVKTKRKEDKSEKTHGSPLGKSLYSLSDLFGGKKKKEEFERIMKELEEKRILLDERENQFINEKRSINEQRNEFHKWREKLEILEDEIHKREDELINREEVFKKALLAGSDKEFQPVSPYVVTSEEIVDHPDFLDKISESAIVLQRGILKQVNDSFVKLVGYKSEEIIEKSVFDFIAPEGFSKVESYYLNRLKGENISTYETIFLTKDNNKIAVEISNRPTTFNGEKAEIAVIKKLKS